MEAKNIDALFEDQPEVSLESRVLLIELQLVGLADKLNDLVHSLAELEQELAEYKNRSTTQEHYPL